MVEYGVTEHGFVRKRLDVIRDDIYTKIKEGWGYDTTINPQSLLNVLITGFADEVAKLWEVAENNYYAMYTMSAEGANLDNAMQFGGISRDKDVRTTYMLSCTAPDDTIVPYGTMAKSATNPEKYFRCTNQQIVSRYNFRRIVLQLYLDAEIRLFYITINRENFQYVMKDGEAEQDILMNLKSVIKAKNVNAQIDIENRLLILEGVHRQTAHTLDVSNNILVVECTSNILFESTEYGQVVIADGLISELVDGDIGITKITNDIPPILGRFEADDIEARQSFIHRCALRSKNMLDSITAEIKNSVDNVLAVAGYENDQEQTDEEGRPPKSVEIIVDGGDEGSIANIIYQKKTNGVRAYGNVLMDVSDNYGNIHKIGFSRPDYLYVWLRVAITGRPNTSMVPNYVQLVQESIIEDAKYIQVGESVYLQTFFTDLYEKVINISLIEIQAYATESKEDVPYEYPLKNIVVGSRQKVVFEASRIKVVLV